MEDIDKNQDAGRTGLPYEQLNKAYEEAILTVSQLQAALESTNDGILVVDRNGRITNFNKRFVDLWQIPDDIILLKDDKKTLDFVLDQLKNPDSFLEKVNKLYSEPEADSFDILEFLDGRIFERYSQPQWLEKQVEGRVWSFRDVTARVHAEETLRQEEKQYQVLFDGANDAIFIMSEDRFIQCNEMTLRMFECNSKDELIGHHPWEFSPEKQPDGSASGEKATTFISAALKGEPQRFYWKHSTHKGNLIDCEVSLNLIKFDQHDFLQAIVRDISEQVQSAKALKESQELYSSVVNNSNDAIIIIQNGIIVFINEAAEKQTGYPITEFLGSSMLDFVRQEDREKVFQNYINRMKGLPVPNIYDVVIVKKDGTSMNAEINSSIIQYKGKPAGLVIVRDLSERKKAEEEIKDREFWLLESQKFARIGTYYLDVASSKWKCTEMLEEIFGIDEHYPKDVEGWVNLIFADDQQEMNTYFRQYIIASKHPFDKEYRILRQNDQAVRWVWGRGDLTFAENGSVVAMLGTIQDITERRKLDDELKIARDKAEESSRLKTSLLLNISHELRTPLNGILGFAEILKDSLTDSAFKKMAENILFSGNRLMATLNSIVDLSQLQADTKRISINKVHLGHEVRMVLDNFQHIAQTKNIRMECLIQADVFAEADTHLLNNIVHHLVDNAFKFTDKGIVTISVYPETTGKQRWAVIAVKDTGIGIASENLQLIFDEFRQTSEGMGRSYEGTGLGLTLCKKFCLLMKGEISVESKLGVGSVFKVRLPLYIEKEVATDETQLIAAVPGPEPSALEVEQEKDSCVLLVEDQDYNLDLLEIYLEKTCKTERALDGIMAVKMSFAKKYDAILMDINLGPGMDGLQAIKEIKSINGYEDVPIIAVTGYSTKEEKEKILAGGFTHYIAKPYTRQDLVNIVREALAAR